MATASYICRFDVLIQAAQTNIYLVPIKFSFDHCHRILFILLGSYGARRACLCPLPLACVPPTALLPQGKKIGQKKKTAQQQHT